MNNLEIYHTKSKQSICPQWLKENNLVLWETCVRQIIIGTHKVNTPPKGFHHLSSIKAYRFLLEVICGLHSPMIGETEIMAQFKTLIAKENNHLQYSTIDFSFWRSLQKEAKLVRSKFLKNYGQQSYGGIVFQNSFTSKSIDIIGSGDLASSIATHFSKDDRDLNIHCRNYLKGEKLKQRFPYINSIFPIGSSPTTDSALLVIAAPIESSWLETYLLENKKYKIVIDLRSVQDHEPMTKNISQKYIDLNEVFKMVECGINKVKENAKLAKIEIAKRSLLWQCKAQHRPYGWEEVCVS